MKHSESFLMEEYSQESKLKDLNLIDFIGSEK